MKKISLVMILALVGCHSGKQGKPAVMLTNSGITTSGTIEHFSSGIHQKCPDKGCDDREFYKDATYLSQERPSTPISPGNGVEMKGSHIVWLKDGGYLCEANDGSQNNSCREVEQGEIDWHAAHPEDYTRSFYKSVEKAK